ncbi:MAG: class I SAM-dependent methyltransferase [Clostridia bacterium]|nr:class I SAM-dependent methyltransferase [Clostridia bacterium]
MFLSDSWKDYELIDASDGERLERFGKYIFVRPDPKILWKSEKRDPRWKSAHAKYCRSNTGGGHWETKNVPDEWDISWRDLTFTIHPMNFKHTGIFPEQAANWDFIQSKIRKAERPVKLLNLFAYTGAATAAAAEAGAEVVHVDAARGMVARAKENLNRSGLSDRPVRFFVDDCEKLVRREIRRGNRYDAIVMDPPSFGRGPGGETWKIEHALFDFLKLTQELLTDDALFVIVNTYSDGITPGSLDTLVKTAFAPLGGRVTTGELTLPITSSGLTLPCGAASRWEGDLR